MENEKKYFVIQYEIGDLDVKTLHDLFEQLKATCAEFSDNDVIMLPNICQFTEMTIEELKQVRDLLNYVLEKKNDTNGETGAGS